MSKTFWIDSHCHLDRYDDLESVLDRAHKVGLKLFLAISVSMQNFQKVLPIAEKFPHVYAAVGVHPCESASCNPEETYQWLKHWAQHPKVVALGETGLDCMPQSPDIGQQKDILQAHTQVALETDLPLIIHMRASEQPFLQWFNTLSNKPRGVMHCFTSTLECAQTVIEWHWKISLSGILTFNNARDLQEVTGQLPLESLLLETDAPWLAPQMHRGQHNEPAYMVETAQKLAQLKSVTLDNLQKQIQHNFFQLFTKIKSPLE